MKKKAALFFALLAILVVLIVIPVKTDGMMIFHFSGVEVGNVQTMITGCQCPLKNYNCGCAIIF